MKWSPEGIVLGSMAVTKIPETALAITRTPIADFAVNRPLPSDDPTLGLSACLRGPLGGRLPPTSHSQSASRLRNYGVHPGSEQLLEARPRVCAVRRF